MDLAAILTHHRQFGAQHPHLLRDQQHLHDRVLDLGQECPPKVGQRVMVRMQIPGNIPHGHTLVGRTFQLPAAEHPGHVAIRDHAHQQPGIIRLPAFRTIAPIDGGQVQQANQDDHKARQMFGRQALADPYLRLQRGRVVRCLECSTHTLHHSIAACLLAISDSLLGVWQYRGTLKTAG